jgi:hypothetical protein
MESVARFNYDKTGKPIGDKMNIDREKLLTLAVDLLADYASTPLWEIDQAGRSGRVRDLLIAAGYHEPPEIVLAADFGWCAPLGEFVRAVVKETEK